MNERRYSLDELKMKGDFERRHLGPGEEQIEEMLEALGHHSMEALIEEGPAGLPIVRLARRLGVMSGSFYWHFRNRNDFRDRLLARWLEEIDAAVSQGDAGGQTTKLGEFGDAVASRKLPDLDLGMRPGPHATP